MIEKMALLAAHIFHMEENDECDINGHTNDACVAFSCILDTEENNGLARLVATQMVDGLKMSVSPFQILFLGGLVVQGPSFKKE